MCRRRPFVKLHRYYVRNFGDMLECVYVYRWWWCCRRSCILMTRTVLANLIASGKPIPRDRTRTAAILVPHTTVPELSDVAVLVGILACLSFCCGCFVRAPSLLLSRYSAELYCKNLPEESSTYISICCPNFALLTIHA